jgi:plastocyanin
VRQAATAVAAIAALATAGCGEKRETTTGGGSPAGAPIGISETEFKLTPSSVQVDEGGAVSIEVTNDGSVTHALAVVGPTGTMKTATIAPGKSATLRADLSKPGTYAMYCPIDGHRNQGMNGEIKVGSGG